jgi:GGDEF domain-containing protein
MTQSDPNVVAPDLVAVPTPSRDATAVIHELQMRGEQSANRIRFWLGVVFTLCMIPMWSVNTPTASVIFLAMCLVLVCFSVGLGWYLRRIQGQHSHVRYVSVTVDVLIVAVSSLASHYNYAGIIEFIWLMPASFGLFNVFAALRYSRGACLYSGALSAFSYLGICTIAVQFGLVELATTVDYSGTSITLEDMLLMSIVMSVPAIIAAALVAQTQRVIADVEVGRQANPLTRLPGNIAIQSVIQQSLDQGLNLAVVHADLDSFKVYNDRYGCARGDDVLGFTADTLREALEAVCQKSFFLGHIGGDDFVFVVPVGHLQRVQDEIQKKFDAGITAFYDPDTVAKQGFEAKDRRGLKQHFGLCSLSMSGMTLPTSWVDHHAQVFRVCAEVKTVAKGIPGTVLVMDRRHGAPSSAEA